MLRKLENINWLMVFMHALSFVAIAFTILKIFTVFTFSWWIVLIPVYILTLVHLYIFITAIIFVKLCFYYYSSNISEE